MPFDKELREHEARRAKALAMGGERKLAERKAQGVLNARERQGQRWAAHARDHALQRVQHLPLALVTHQALQPEHGGLARAPRNR